MQEGGCRGFLLGMRAKVPLDCLCLGTLPTPETTVHLLGGLFMGSVIQVKVQMIFSDIVAFTGSNVIQIPLKTVYWCIELGHFTVMTKDQHHINELHTFSAAVRAVHRVLEHRYHSNPWPSTKLQITQLKSWILKRVNEASGPYQMFGVLADVILLKE